MFKSEYGGVEIFSFLLFNFTLYIYGEYFKYHGVLFQDTK